VVPVSQDQGQELPIAVLLSGTGRTLQNLLRSIEHDGLAVKIVAVGSDRAGARGLEHAIAAGIPTRVFPRQSFQDRRERDREIFRWVQGHSARVLCLAGYLAWLDLSASEGLPVLNIHPALLPRFGGAGFYGDRVHAAVLEAGETRSGATVHIVNERYDEGAIVARIEVPVLPDDDVARLGARVFAAECLLYPKVLRWISEGKLFLRDGRPWCADGEWKVRTLEAPS
jgi:phosphoribosylglycinamide formyltransferase-1